MALAYQHGKVSYSMTNIYNRINNYSPSPVNYHNINMQDYDWIPRGDYNEIIHHKSYNTKHGFSKKNVKQ